MKFPKIECSTDDCRIQNLGSSTTLLGWTPIYDKFGNLINRNPNKTRTHYRCVVCDKVWVIEE